MRPHIKLQLEEGVVAPDAPYWGSILGNKARVPTKLHPAIDRVLAQARAPVWVTAEYPRSAQAWHADEVHAGLDRVYRLILRNHHSFPADLVEKIRLIPQVKYAHLGRIAETPIPTPRAQAFATSDHHMRSREEILLPEAHAITRGSPKIIVAVLDTGVTLSHPELQHCLVPGFDFVDIIDNATAFIGDFIGADPVPDDEVGHGTHVAGIIAARGMRMPIGVAPKCKLMPVRVLGAMEKDGRRVGAGLIDNINTAVKWAVDHGAQVINMSLGVKHEGGGLPHEEVITYARRKGVTVVAASGNGGGEDLFYPGALPHVITVGAAEDDGEVAPYSSWGRQVSLVAPGTDIFSSYLENGYALSTGTSHAAPFVAGAAALLRSHALERGRRLRDSQVKHVLQHTADKLDRSFKNLKAGYGRLNVRDALRLLDHRLEAS